MSALRGARAAGRGVDRFFNAHVWALPFVLTVGMIVILVGTVETVNLLRGNQHELRDNQHELRTIQVAQYRDQLESCRRSNHSRVANITNLRDDLRNLEADRRLLRELAPAGHLRREVIEAKTEAIKGKRQAIMQTILSQAPVAIHPGSPIADCQKANSLPVR